MNIPRVDLSPPPDGDRIWIKETSSLALLRLPFPDHQISKLPKATCSAEEYARLPKSSCTECGGWHPAAKTIHLDYVGHAASTDRLLDADISWNWEPLALSDEGLPQFDSSGGLWIKLTVCGLTRLGYGHARETKHQEPGARVKEVIGDAIRNAFMRFGGALELWHKGDLHINPVADDTAVEEEPIQGMIEQISACKTLGDLYTVWTTIPPDHQKWYYSHKEAGKARLLKGSGEAV